MNLGCTHVAEFLEGEEKVRNNYTSTFCGLGEKGWGVGVFSLQFINHGKERLRKLDSA